MGIENLHENPEGDQAREADCNSFITCKDCLDVLDQVIDRETDPSPAFKEHLRSCLPCLEKYNLDNAIKEALQKKCPNASPPQDLIANIKDRILRNVGQ